MNTLKIMTLNVNGLRDAHKKLRVQNYIKTNEIDIMLLQETHFNQDKWPKENNIWNGKSNRSGGTGIISTEKVTYNSTSKDIEGNYIISNIKTKNLKITIVNVYGPDRPNQRKEFYNKLYQQLLKFPKEKHIIMAGDFNMVETPEKDRTGGRTSDEHIRGRGELRKIMKELDLTDLAI